MPSTAWRNLFRLLVRLLGSIITWGWTIMMVIGGVGLIITLGPWPPTNGWFALFSGLAACPLTAWAFKKYRGINFPAWARLAAAILIIMAGRLTLKIEGRGNFLPGPPPIPNPQSAML